MRYAKLGEMRFESIFIQSCSEGLSGTQRFQSLSTTGTCGLTFAWPEMTLARVSQVRSRDEHDAILTGCHRRGDSKLALKMCLVGES